MRSLCYVVAVGGLLAVTAPDVVGQETGHEGRRSERGALLLGLSGVTLSGAWSLASGNGAIIAGVMVGPALGHGYAGNYRRAILGSLGRAGLSVVGLSAGFLVCDSDLLFEPCRNEGASNTIVALAAAGVLAWSALDLVKAPESARRHNAKLASRRVAVLAPSPRKLLLEAGPMPACVTICRGQDQGVPSRR